MEKSYTPEQHDICLKRIKSFGYKEKKKKNENFKFYAMGQYYNLCCNWFTRNIYIGLKNERGSIRYRKNGKKKPIDKIFCRLKEHKVTNRQHTRITLNRT